MFIPLTFHDYCNAMQTRATVSIHPYTGVINAIQAEDGSGRRWNVTILLGEKHGEQAGEEIMAFVQT